MQARFHLQPRECDTYERLEAAGRGIWRRSAVATVEMPHD